MRPAPPTPDALSALEPPEIVVVDSHRVVCDGPEGGALGHPRVFMEMGDSDFVECGYCDRRFVLAHPTAEPRDEDPRLDPADYEGAGGN